MPMDEYWLREYLDNTREDMKQRLMSILKDSGDFSRIEPDYVSPKRDDGLDSYANMQKPRHIHLLTRPKGDIGELEILVLVNSQPFPSDDDLRKKLEALSQRGIYVFPVLFKGTDSPFFTKFGKGRKSIRYLPEDVRGRLIETTKNERTLAELNDGRVYYFNPGSKELWIVDYSKMPIIGDYHDRPDIFKKLADLVTVKSYEDIERMTRFTLVPYEKTSSGILIARPNALESPPEQLRLF